MHYPSYDWSPDNSPTNSRPPAPTIAGPAALHQAENKEAQPWVEIRIQVLGQSGGFPFYHFGPRRVQFQHHFSEHTPTGDKPSDDITRDPRRGCRVWMAEIDNHSQLKYTTRQLKHQVEKEAGWRTVPGTDYRSRERPGRRMADVKMATASSIGKPAIRRGRKEKPWPVDKQKKLLRLYVCTQSEKLPLVRILERLKDGTFDPRQRNTHKHLKNLLPDRRIDDWRPRDMTSMLVRVRFLRSVREERRMRNRRARQRLEAARSRSYPDPMSASVLSEPPRGFYGDSSDTSVTIKQSDSPGSSPLANASASSADSPDTFMRDKSPSRASSLTPSAKRRSWASVLSSISSGISSLARSSSSASSRRINLNNTGANTALSKMTREEFLASLQDRPRKPFKGAKAPNGLFKPKYSTVNPTTEELNKALVDMCCSNYYNGEDRTGAGCVHERLSRAIDAQATENSAFTNFSVTEHEANMVDKYGNSLLHVAARWGARVSLLLLIIRHTDDLQMVNQRGETFLHVYDPPSQPKLRPVSFLNLVRVLRSRGFDFCLRDGEKHTFLHHIVSRREFPIETLYYVFREVGHGAARFLVASKAADGERLWHSVRRNLERTAPKLHRIFGDEVEFIRRYLPEFSDSKAPSTGDNSTCGSDSLYSLPHHHQEAMAMGDPNDSSAQHVRRSPIMKLLRRAAAGRTGFSDADLTKKLESIFETASKAPDFDLHSYLVKRDTEGNTALHYASEFGIVTAVQFLCGRGANVNEFNNCGNTPLQLVKYAIQRTDVRSDIHMEARYLRCAVLLLEQGAFDQSKLVSERSIIFPYANVFDGSERSIQNLMKQGVANQCKGLHLLTSSPKHHGLYYGLEGHDHGHCHGHGHAGGGTSFGWVDHGGLLDGLMGRRPGSGRGRKRAPSPLGAGGGPVGGGAGPAGMNMTFQTSVLSSC
ncbi:hypothetical protein QBC40DRAFT_300317 [Triangularia verruculosa]|uniref:Ankyrin n=1 Tax=Triangularia verruculosa TaxID=2587418 RepID=A0AAN6X976_9PEZI|nr:hypothetical protein QBC40DRAFT_300317 [Triangularia verruculosa]